MPLYRDKHTEDFPLKNNEAKEKEGLKIILGRCPDSPPVSTLSDKSFYAKI